MSNPPETEITDNNENDSIKANKKIFGDIELTVPALLVDSSTEPTVTSEKKELGIKKKSKSKTTALLNIPLNAQNIKNT